jgi:VIT1/CCC1 family predicted Fe2+/Mn2+ transporter
MVSYASDDPFVDPFIITSEKPLDLKLMFEAGLRTASDRANERIQMAIDKDDVILPPVPYRTRKYHKRDVSFREFWTRFYMAFFGGLALVGPMLIMVLYKRRYTPIVTVSVSVFLFAVAVAAFSPEKPTTVLGVVAAYAAVLVVFLGTSS